MFIVGFSWMPFLRLRSFLSISNLLSYYSKWMLSFVKCFFSAYWSIVFLLFYINMIYYIDFLKALYPSSGGKLHLVMRYFSFYILLYLTCSYFVTDFLFVFMKDICSFLNDIFFKFWYQSNTDLIKWAGKYSLHSLFWKNLCGIISPLNIW